MRFFDRYIFNATTFDVLRSIVIEKEETLVSPLVIKRRIDQAFQNVEEIISKHGNAFAKVGIEQLRNER